MRRSRRSAEAGRGRCQGFDRLAGGLPRPQECMQIGPPVGKAEESSRNKAAPEVRSTTRRQTHTPQQANLSDPLDSARPPLGGRRRYLCTSYPPRSSLTSGTLTSSSILLRGTRPPPRRSCPTHSSLFPIMATVTRLSLGASDILLPFSLSSN